MEAQLTEKEIEFCEHFYTPDALTENLFPKNFDSPYCWDEECECITVRGYQYALQNYSSLYAYDPKLSEKKNFLIQKGAGDCYAIGSRNTGKSWWLIIDTNLQIPYNCGQGLVASDSAKHLNKVTEPINNYADSHPFFRMFHLKQGRSESVKRNPLTITMQNGTTIRSANENTDSKNPGEQFHGPHPKVMYYEEFSYCSPEGFQKAIDTRLMYGRIERFSGIPDVSLGSPLGKILKNPKLKPWIWKLPQLVREDWDEETQQELADLHGGLSSASYKLNVMAETIEGAFGFFDMQRFKEASLNESKRIKSFEISKESYQNYDEQLIVERPAGTQQVFINGDLGFGAAPTELSIIFFDGKKYHYIYNVTLFRLSPEEQPYVIKFLYDKLGGAFIALDSTSDSGAMIDRLFAMGIPQEYLLKVRFTENIEVGFEKTKDEQGNEIVVVDREGNPVPKMINTELFSFQELERLMYSGDMDLWYDEKIIQQFTDIIAKQSGTRLNFDSKGVNHIVQSFQCFAISRFFNEWNTIKNNLINSNKRGFCSLNTED